MKGKVFVGQLVSFDTDRGEVELLDREIQETIRFSVNKDVILPESCGWEDLFMQEVKVGAVDNVITQIDLCNQF